VCAKKAIAPRCRGSRSRGGRGRETRSRSLFFGRGRRPSVNERRGQHNKRATATSGPSGFVPRSVVKEPRQGGWRQRLRRSGWSRLRQKRRGIGGSGRESHDNDGSSRRDDGSSRYGHNNVDPTGKAATTMEPTMATMKGEGDGAGPAGQGPVPDLAGLVDVGDERSMKREALLGGSGEGRGALMAPPILELASQRGRGKGVATRKRGGAGSSDQGSGGTSTAKGKGGGPWGDGCHGQQGEMLGGGQRRTQQRGSQRPDPQPWGACAQPGGVYAKGHDG
jgi:hypothetical protein